MTLSLLPTHSKADSLSVNKTISIDSQSVSKKPGLYSSTGIRLLDSIHVEGTGGVIVNNDGAGHWHGNVAGTLRAGISRTFSEHISIEAQAACKRSAPTPTVEIAALTFNSKAGSGQIGILSRRYGSARFYRPQWFASPLYDQYLLYDQGGYGGGLLFAKKALRGEISVLLDAKENSGTDISLSAEKNGYEVRAVGAMRTYTATEQDNVITVGAELGKAWKYGGLHGLFRYDNFQGFGNNTNPRMHPGYGTTLFAEGFIQPDMCLKFSGYIRSQTTVHFVDDSTTTRLSITDGGLHGQLLIAKVFNIECAFEGMKSKVTTTIAPEILVGIAPQKFNLGFNAGLQLRKTNTTKFAPAIASGIWFGF